MTIEEKIQAVLIADAGVTAITTAKRIKVGFVGQKLDLPYIAHFPAAQNAEARTSEGVNNFREWPFYQISCFADTYSAALALALAVINLFKNYRTGNIQVIDATRGPDIYEDDVKVHQIPVNLEIADNL